MRFFLALLATTAALNPSPKSKLMPFRLQSQQASKTGIDFFQNHFENFVPKTQDEQIQLELRHDILKSNYLDAKSLTHERNVISCLIHAIPKNLTLDKKLDWICYRLSTYKAMAVMTVHPTRALSNEALHRLHQIVTLALSMDDPKTHTVAVETRLTDMLNQWISQPILPEKNLTPQQEAETALFIYQNMLDSFPDFFSDVVQRFIDVHGGHEECVAQALKASIKLSYRNIFSWVRGDADGNHQVSAATMALTVPTQQRAIIELYIKRINNILSYLDSADTTSIREQLQSINLYFQRCIKSIDAGIWFDVTGSDEAKQRAHGEIQRVLDASTHLHLAKLRKDLLQLQDLIDLEGFFGGMKEFVRQTSKVNLEVMDNIAAILTMHHDDIRMHMQASDGSMRSYQALNQDQKLAFCAFLVANPNFFATLKNNKAAFSAETNKELDRLNFISQHRDIFPAYISSDTEHKSNMNEVFILYHLACYLQGALHIGQSRRYPLHYLPLCETPRDLNHFPSLFTQLLDDPYYREQIITHKAVSYVSGPSDLSKAGGIFVYLALILNQLIAENLLNKYKKQYPELEPVTLRVLHGFGSDMKRRFGSARFEAHCTHQGWDAYKNLGAPNAYPAYLKSVVGYPSESDFKVSELRLIKRNHPKAFQNLKRIKDSAVYFYEKFIHSDANKRLLVLLTHVGLEKKMNISSRAGSKKPTDDPTKVRAIGMVNLYLLTGVNWDIFMSAAGLLHLDAKSRDALPLLFEQSTGVRDIIYKLFFSIAISNIPRAWQKICDTPPSDMEKQSLTAAYRKLNTNDIQPEHTLAYIENTAHVILERLMFFLPKAQQDLAHAYWQRNSHHAKPSHVIALELMDALGGDFSLLADETRELLPRFERFWTCIDCYENNPNPLTEENVVVACRVFQLAAGPKFISDAISPLHEQAINNNSGLNFNQNQGINNPRI